MTLNQDQLHFWYLIVFLLGMVEGLVGTFFPLVFLEQGGSIVTLGVIMSLVSLSGVLQSLWGAFIDRTQRPKGLGITALTLGTANLITMAAVPSTAVFGGSRVSQGLSTSAFNTGNTYLRSAYFPSSKRGRIGNLFMGFNLLGVALGVFSVGSFYNWAGIANFPFIHFIAAYLAAITVVLIWKFLPEFREDLIADEQLRFAMVEQRADLRYSLRDTIAIAKQSSGLLPFMLGTLVFHFGVGISGPYFIVDLSNRWALSSLEIGYITTFNAVLQVIIIFLYTPLVDIIDRKIGYTIGIFFAVVPVMAMVLEPYQVLKYFPSSLVFWLLVYTLSSLGWGLVNALSLTLLIDYVHPKIRATTIGIYGSAQALLVFFASLFGALLLSTGATIVLIFWLSLIARLLGWVMILLTTKPPIPSSDFYDRRKIFLTRLYTTAERGIAWIPVVGSILSRKKNS